MSRKVLLICGILSPLLYGVSDVLAGMRWDGYSFRHQTISELGAIGAPSRALFAVLLLIVYGLMVAFGVGIRKAAGENRRLRIAGGLLIGVGVMALTVGPFAAMRPRGTEQGLAGAMHLLEGMVAMLMIFTAMGIAATAIGTRFRVYTIATIVLALGFGGWAGLEAPRIEQGVATPWVGVKERIFWYAYQSWYIVLALTLLRRRVEAGTEDSGYRAFKTPDGEARFLAAYDAVLKLWPVPCEELDIPTRFGVTHVVAAGPKNAPALVLLHGYMATSAMWAPNIADFSRDYRVYAIDIMGQPGKSVPDDPIRDAADYVAWLTATLDGMDLGRVSLVGMSFGGWVALQYAVAAPERVQRLVLLSPGGFLPMVKQFILRGMLMAFFPTRFTVNSFMRWAGLTASEAEPELDLMYLGMKHFRMPRDTMRVNRDAAKPLSDDELRSLRMPVLLLFGDGEVIYDSAQAFDRARRLITHFEGELIPGCRHDMCFSQSGIVNARVLDFLKKRGDEQAATEQFGSVSASSTRT